MTGWAWVIGGASLMLYAAIGILQITAGLVARIFSTPPRR